MKQNRFKAILFDMDGTLVDTEKYFRLCWPKAFQHFGYEMADDEYLSIRSLGKPFIFGRLKEISGDENFDYDAVVKYRAEIMEEMIAENGLQAKKGAKELLEFLRAKGICCAVVTASPKDRSERYLGQLGLLDYFDDIISARGMKAGKPEPDVYLYACQQLGLHPEECLAVEDSPNGALSASRAGCKVVFVPDQSPVDDATRPLLLAEVKSLDEIAGLLD